MRKPRVTARWTHPRGSSSHHGIYEVKIDGEKVARVGHAKDIFSPDPKRRAGYWIYYGRFELGGKTFAKNSSHTKEDWETAELARDACIAWIKGVIDEHQGKALAGGRAGGSDSGG